MGVTVKVIGLTEAINNIDDYIARKKRGLLGAVAQGSTQIQNEAKRNAPEDLGTLRNDITHTIIEKKDRIEGRILSAATYSAFVEYGTRPHFPPPKALAGWAARHGMAGAEYQIARKIAMRGTRAQPFMLPAFMKVKRKFIRSVKQVMSSP